MEELMYLKNIYHEIIFFKPYFNFYRHSVQSSRLTHPPILENDNKIDVDSKKNQNKIKLMPLGTRSPNSEKKSASESTQQQQQKQEEIVSNVGVSVQKSSETSNSSTAKPNLLEKFKKLDKLESSSKKQVLHEPRVRAATPNQPKTTVVVSPTPAPPTKPSVYQRYIQKMNERDLKRGYLRSEL